MATMTGRNRSLMIIADSTLGAMAGLEPAHDWTSSLAPLAPTSLFQCAPWLH